MIEALEFTEGSPPEKHYFDYIYAEERVISTKREAMSFLKVFLIQQIFPNISCVAVPGTL